MKPVRTVPRDRKDAREMMVRWVPPVPRELMEPMERLVPLERPELMEQLGPTESLVQLVLLVRERSFHLRQGFRFH